MRVNIFYVKTDACLNTIYIYIYSVRTYLISLLALSKMTILFPNLKESCPKKCTTQSHGAARSSDSSSNLNYVFSVSGFVQIETSISCTARMEAAMKPTPNNSTIDPGVVRIYSAGQNCCVLHNTIPPQPPLDAMDDFASKYCKYPHCIVTIYQIVRDLYIKQELSDLTIVDGECWNVKEYYIEGRSKMTGLSRLMVPFYLDADIDLQWLQKIAAECHANQKEMYICVHTPESIIYELLTVELP